MCILDGEYMNHRQTDSMSPFPEYKFGNPASQYLSSIMDSAE